MLTKSKGFTLIELMVTVVILALIATVAVPGFGNLIGENRLTTGTNLLASSIRLARAEAIKRGTTVTFSTDGGLANGWCVHTGDDSGDCANDQIRGFEGPGNLTYTATAADLVFDRRGFLTPQVGHTFTVAPNDCPAGGRLLTVRVSPVGRTEIDPDVGACP
ncbi:GspH/FimT family pseudopilin [Marinobacter sp.]|uniref:GspH/FimT family pseudopilin n=1 Tax=Marinobacter sp. TaxID=50741 RepID=UPI0035C724E4|nr:GspH/FimT family pseudopilin [Oleiphilaceae bacterium]